MIYRFEGFDLDTERHELRHAGVQIDLQPKALGILHYLIRQRDRVVSRDELFEEIWPDVVVSEDALFVALKKVRAALGDDGAQQRAIKTIPRMGYRFVLPVEEGVADPRADAAAPHALVGRSRELASLEGAMEAALHGQGRFVLLSGSAGIGKSRLATELATRARTRGAEVHEATAWQGDGAPAFWLWVQIVRDFVEEWSGEALRAAMGLEAGDIARIVPSLQAKLGVSVPVVTDGDEARFRLMDAIARFVTRAARVRPQVLVLEDLQWMGAASLQALRLLAEALVDAPILVIGTWRDDAIEASDAVESMLTAFDRRDVLVPVPVSGFTVEEVGALVEEIGGFAPSPGLARAVHEATDGNPFFVKQVVVWAIDEHGEAPELAERLASRLHDVPTSVRHLVDQRLATLPEECRRAIGVAAVAGRQMPLALLVRASGLPREELLVAIGAALEARLIEPVSGSEPAYRFVHAMVREAAYVGLSEAARVQLHLDVARALEAMHEGNLGPAVPALANHFGKAALLLSGTEAVDYAKWAGHQATEALAFEEAADHFGHALRALDLRNEPSLARRAELAVCLGFARQSAGQNEEGRTQLREAVELARRVGDGRLQTMAALGLSQFVFGWFDAEASELLEEALEALGEEAGYLPAWTRCILACHLANRPERLGDALRLVAEAADAARGLGDPRLVAASLAAEAAVERLAREGRPERRLALLERAVAAAQHAGDPSLELMVRVQREGALLELGDRDAMDAEYQQLRALAESRRSPQWRWLAAARKAMRDGLEGRLEEAELLVRETYGKADGPRFESTPALGAFLCMIRFEQGRLAEMLPFFDPLVARFPHLPALAAGRLMALLEVGREEEARAGLDALAQGDFESVLGTESWVLTLTILAELALGLADVLPAKALRRLLESRAAHWAIAVNGAYSNGPVSLYLGRLALLSGDFGAATAHLELALERAELMRASLWRAHVLAAQARAYRSSGGRGDSDRARACALEARGLSRDLGLVRLLRELDSQAVA